MSHVIPLDIPDDLYQRIEEMAARRGQSPDEFLLALIERAVGVRDDASVADETSAPTYDPQADPLARFAGIFNGPGDLAERHDEYLAQAYADTHEDE